jgi:hypothetical protein
MSLAVFPDGRTGLCSLHRCWAELSRVTLQLTVNWSVLALRPSGTHDQILAVVRQLRDWCHGAPFLTGGRVCHVRVTVLVCEYVSIFGKFSSSESSNSPGARATATQKPTPKVENPTAPPHRVAPAQSVLFLSFSFIRGCIQKFPDWPPGARTANGTALCH